MVYKEPVNPCKIRNPYPHWSKRTCFIIHRRICTTKVSLLVKWEQGGSQNEAHRRWRVKLIWLAVIVDSWSGTLLITPGKVSVRTVSLYFVRQSIAHKMFSDGRMLHVLTVCGHAVHTRE